MTVVFAFTVLAGIVYVLPHVELAAAYGGVLAVVLFTACKAAGLDTLLAGSLFALVLGLGLVLSAMTSTLEGSVLTIGLGVLIGVGHLLTYAHIDLLRHAGAIPRPVLDYVEPVPLPVLALPAAPAEPQVSTLEARRHRALEYVFGYSGQAGDGFKDRITRDRLEKQRLLSQKEWADWMRDLRQAGIIETPNKQLTLNLVQSFAAAGERYDAWRVSFEPDPANRRKLLRKVSA